MGPMRLMGLIGLMGLMGCSGGEDATGQTPTTPPTPTTPTITETAITFSGQQSEEQAVSRGANRANEANGPYSRRAGTPLSDTGVHAFTVWGYKNMSYTEATASYGDLQTVFPGYIVNWTANSAATTTTNSNGWEYISSDPEQTIKYWDWGAKAYRYFAVTGWSWAEPPTPPATYEANKTYGANEAYGAYAFSMLADASNATEMAKSPYFTRLWFSTGNQVAYPDKQFGKPVTLEFVKPYTRVRFQFKYSYPREGIKLTEKSFKPTYDVTAAEGEKVKIARKGIVTVHYPTEGTAIKEWYSVVVDDNKSTRLSAFTEDFDAEDNGKEYTETDEGWYWVLPRTSQDSYTLSVSVNGGDLKTAVVPAEYMQWLPGYSYTYIFKITEEGGVEIGWVEYAMTPWTEMTATKTVYNW